MRRFLKNLVFGLAAGVTYIDLIGYVARVEGQSMQPTLNPINLESDYVFLNKFKAKDFKVSRGEIVCLISPKDAQQRIIKRVIAREGDVVHTIGYKEKYVKVPAGHFWIEGDNVNNSLDSNTFGPVPLGLLTAKATHIVWPLSRIGSLNVDDESVRQPIKFGKKSTLSSS
ncbi:hypothetical protein PVAND_010337 [Polypedilum vanderplanki]|uniref:Mitochondrial inner membrane protease subunit n=1 Tax=Polypedilum vanderplanki TaxID=319348 RepID=A0A9J6CGB7_POLVA|nr:hypothetical protein PVAND_010337 [Polypedilum vanderplanki]